MKKYSFAEMGEQYLNDVLEIYNYYIANSTATFHSHAITADEMRGIVFFSNPVYSSYAILEDGALCGYCLYTQFKKREAYDGAAEITIYLRHGFTGKGIGMQAVEFIEGVAREKGIHTLIAVICGENTESIRLFEKNGYFKCAHYKEVGKKFGRLLDVVGYQKLL